MFKIVQYPGTALTGEYILGRMVTNFIDEIREYFYANIDTLDVSKQFHFASRLAAWEGDVRAYELLKRTKSFLLPDETAATKKVILKELLERTQTGKRNAHELRLPFFAKYPDLYGLELATFRVRHLKYIYGIDLTDDLFALYPKARIDVLKEQLLNDREGIKYLSTFAINFLYLTDIVLHNTKPHFDIQPLYELGLTYNLQDIDQIQLLLYLYTHCIISETNFYLAAVHENTLPTYTRMLAYAETVIRDNFARISLDNKLEFLVAARICGYITDIDGVIYDECRHSLSPEGTFIIDRHNLNIRPELQSFKKAEHRNTLLIMSQTKFSPYSMDKLRHSQ